VKISVAAVETLKKKEKQGETQEPSKLMLRNHAQNFFAGFFLISPCV